MKYSLLSAAILSTLVMTGCGGGGASGSGNVRPASPPPIPPTTPTTSTPPPRYQGRISNTLVPANFDLAHAAGFTGKGVKVGVLDDPMYADHAPIKDKVVYYKDYSSRPGVAEADSNTTRGHGTVVATLLAGTASDGYAGGAAPGVELYWGRICANNSCNSLSARNAINDLADMGVRLVNVSMGSYLSSETSARQAADAWAYAAERLLKNDGLFVAATGNVSMAQPGYPAATPVYRPETMGQWLAVGAVDIDSDGKPSGLSSYSNQCGVAAQWCLTAPGLHQFPAVTGTDFQGAGMGTSFATPLVTAAAALVWQAFPWMSANNVQQTVLTTATDLGDAGVDAVYGWGFLDANKAVAGPGQFVGDFSANVVGDSTFANAIGGNGGLIKQGSGRLVLAADNSYRGGTRVQAGTLGLQGDVAGDVSIEAGAQLQALGGAIGGNYVAGDGATTAIAIGKPLVVAGSAHLDGNLLLMAEASGYQVAGQQTLLSAQAISGRFDAVTYANDFFWKATLGYADTEVVAELSRSSASAQAMALGSAQAVIDGARQADVLVAELDRRVVAGETAGLEPVLAATASLMQADGRQTAAAMASLTGQVHGVARALAVQASVDEARLAADRLPDLRATTAPTAWVQADGVEGQWRRSGYADADTRRHAVHVGMDLPLGPGLVSLALSKGGEGADIADSRSRFDADRIGLTASWVQPWQGGYAAVVLGHAQSNVDSQRTLQAGNQSERVHARRDDRSWQLRLETGLELARGMTPFLAAGMVRQQQGAFDEAGRLGLGLRASTDAASFGYSDLGLRHRFQHGAWKVDGQLAWRHVWSADDTGFRAAFTGLDTTSFEVAGEPLATDAWRVGLGLRRDLGQYGQLQANTGWEQADGDQRTFHWVLGWRRAF